MITVRPIKIAALTACAALFVAGAGMHSSTLRAQPAPAPVCMMKAPANAVPLTVMVASSRQAELEGAGFAAQACAGKEAQAAQYRSDICSLAAGMPQPAQQQFSQAYSISVGRLCELAGEIG